MFGAKILKGIFDKKILSSQHHFIYTLKPTQSVINTANSKNLLPYAIRNLFTRKMREILINFLMRKKKSIRVTPRRLVYGRI